MIIVIIIALLLSSCSILEKKPEKSAYPEIHMSHQALINQRLIPRPGNVGFLTNQVCLKYVGKVCQEKSIIRYDLMEMDVRKGLVNNLKFACKIGSKRYRISIEHPAIVRQEKGCIKWKKRAISRKKYCSQEGVVKSEFIHIGEAESYQKLIDGALECRSGY